MIPPEVAALAEDPSASGPDPAPESGLRRILTDRYCVLFMPVDTSVSRLRLREDEVEDAVAEIRALTAGAPGKTAWWVGSSAAPGDVRERLLALGLRPATDPGWEPRGTAMATVTPPPGSEGVVARLVETYEEFVRANEIGWEAFGLTADERAQHLTILPERWEAALAGHANVTFMAWVDGEPAGIARALLQPEGAVLLGGGVLPWARGLGAYRALVRARWDAAVARGTPALAVTAGAMSRPILERLGFQSVATVEVLLDDPR